MTDYEKSILNNINSNIQCLIEERHIPVSDVEKAIGVSVGYLSRLKKHNMNLPITKVAKLADYFNVTIDNLAYCDFRIGTLERKIQCLQNELATIRKEKVDLLRVKETE